MPRAGPATHAECMSNRVANICRTHIQTFDGPCQMIRYCQAVLNYVMELPKSLLFCSNLKLLVSKSKKMLNCLKKCSKQIAPPNVRILELRSFARNRARLRNWFAQNCARFAPYWCAKWFQFTAIKTLVSLNVLVSSKSAQVGKKIYERVIEQKCLLVGSSRYT